jgi:hypothetical protein
MFEPKTFWDQRSALNESLIMHLLDIVGAADPDMHNQISARWMGQQSQLKNFEVRRILGAPGVIDGTTVADEDWINELLQQNLGKEYFSGVDTFEAPADAIGQDSEAYVSWLANLPDFHQNLSADIAPGFYREQAGDSVGVLLVFVANDMLYAIAAAAYLNIQQISLKHLPEVFSWRNGYFRSEFFDYRNDLTRDEVVYALGRALYSEGFNTTLVHGLTTEAMVKAERQLLELDVPTVKPTIKEAALVVVEQKPEELDGTKAANDDVGEVDLPWEAGEDVTPAETTTTARGMNVPYVHIDDPVFTEVTNDNPEQPA